MTRTGMAYGMQMFLFLVVILVPWASATQLKVGGSMGWAVPSNPNAFSYDQWARKLRFQIGDSLLFVYSAGSDSVLEVSKEDHDACNTKSPIAKYDGGSSVVTLNRSGPHYFISGVEDNCRKQEALVVVVMADRRNRVPPSSPPTTSPAPPPQPDASSSAPPPTQEPAASSPPPPPSAPAEIAPSPPPAEAQPADSTPPPPRKNAAPRLSLNAAGVGTLIGALLAF